MINKQGMDITGFRLNYCRERSRVLRFLKLDSLEERLLIKLKL
jgi:hypothetical protein